MIRKDLPHVWTYKAYMYAGPWVSWPFPGMKGWQHLDLVAYLTLVTSLYYFFQILIQFGHHTQLWIKDYMCEMPGCSPSNSVRIQCGPCEKIMTLVPHNIHSFSKLSVLPVLNGWNPFPLLCSMCCGPQDRAGSCIIHFLIWNAFTGSGWDVLWVIQSLLDAPENQVVLVTAINRGHLHWQADVLLYRLS